MKPVALIIDDEVQIRRLLRVALEGENYQVHEAENGQQGLIEIANRQARGHPSRSRSARSRGTGSVEAIARME